MPILGDGRDLVAGETVGNGVCVDGQPLGGQPDDWTTFRADNRHSDQSRVPVPNRVSLQWSAEICSGDLPTAPVVAGGLVFIGATADHRLRAFDIDTGEVGSGDGRIARRHPAS